MATDVRYSTLSEFAGVIRFEWRTRKAWTCRRAMLVGLWWSLVRRHPGELCEDCGKPYRNIGWWHAPDGLYMRVIGSRGGLFCPACFTARCHALGIRVHWAPCEHGSEEAA